MRFGSLFERNQISQAFYLKYLRMTASVDQNVSIRRELVPDLLPRLRKSHKILTKTYYRNSYITKI